MADTWRILRPGLAYPVGVLACLTLTSPTDAGEADVRNSELSAPTTAGQQESVSIAALLAQLETQIAEDHLTTPQNNNATHTVTDILALLPIAPLSDAEMVHAMPSHLAKRAHEAEAAGRHEEAIRFEVLGNVLGDILSGPTPNDATGQQTPPQPEPASGSPWIAAAPVLRPGDLASVDHAPIGQAHAQDDSMASPPSPAATPSEPPAGSARDSHSDTVSAKAAEADARKNSELSVPATAGQQETASIAALLAKLETQIAEDHLTTLQNNNATHTVTDILALLPNAPLSDADMVHAMPSHLAKRAHEAEAAGRHEEAIRFGALGDALKDIFSGPTPNDAAGQQTPPQPRPAPPPPERPLAARATSVPVPRPAVAATTTTEPDRPVARLAPPIPPPASVAAPALAPTPAPPLARPGQRAAELFARGQEAERLGDVSGARRFYASAVQQGSAAAARNLGRLYDPTYLMQTALGGIDPDLALARHWYERAVAMGDPVAGPLLEALALR